MYKHLTIAIFAFTLGACGGQSDSDKQPITSDVELNSTSDKIKEAQSAAADAASDVLDTMKKGAESAAEDASETMDAIGRGAEEVAQDVQEGVETMKRGLDETVKDFQAEQAPAVESEAGETASDSIE